MQEKKNSLVLKLKIALVIAALLFVTITPIINATNLENTIPPVPDLRGQQNFVLPHKTYDYRVIITEPDNDRIWVLVSWSDGGSTGWKGPFTSGYTYVTSHVWMEGGKTYIVSAKTKDIFDEESDWAQLEIHTLKSRAINLDIIDLILQRFPLIKQLFERLFF